MLDVDQLLVPSTVHPPPRSLEQATEATDAESVTVPPILIVPEDVEKVGSAVGDDMVMVGSIRVRGSYTGMDDMV